MHRLVSLLIAFTLCTVSLAGKKFPLTAATTVPAARGDVEIGHDRNKNTEIKMKVEHLAKPENLTPPKSSYVVWLQEKGSDAENQGQLRLNKKLEGNFRSVTPRKSFDIFITAEQDAAVKAPSGPEVMRATIQQ